MFSEKGGIKFIKCFKMTDFKDMKCFKEVPTLQVSHNYGTEFNCWLPLAHQLDDRCDSKIELTELDFAPPSTALIRPLNLSKW